MAEIIPAIIPKDFAELEEKMSLVKGAVPLVQVDILDGQLTAHASWPYKKHDENFERIQKEEQGMPCWEDLDFEVDLMVKNPENVIDQWVTAGAKRIIIHVDSTNELPEILKKLDGIVEIGLALEISTPLEKVTPFLNDEGDAIQISPVSFIQCMGIEHIGSQGQPFDPRVLEKIKEIKKKYPHMIVSVDGGVSIDTAPQLIEAGADRLVAGSAIFNSDNFVEAIHTLENM